jgi:hypothetical protein
VSLFTYYAPGDGAERFGWNLAMAGAAATAQTSMRSRHECTRLVLERDVEIIEMLRLFPGWRASRDGDGIEAELRHARSTLRGWR